MMELLPDDGRVVWGEWEPVSEWILMAGAHPREFRLQTADRARMR